MNYVTEKSQIRLNGKLYKTRLECWKVDRKIEHRIRVAEIRMIRWISGVA